ncbi:MAG: M48 family metalloprotease [Bacteroidota bacterium]|nr:M48 family metalloprotease [Bacteroidota bacterium]
MRRFFPGFTTGWSGHHSVVILLLAASFLSGCAASTNPISGRRAFNYAWSPAEEIQVGREADPQIVAQYGLYDDPEVSAYVDSLGQALVRLSHVRREAADPVFANITFHFRVLDSPVVNAFALPGGYIYVTRGLLAHLENEAQLAVVIGHEIGHVVGRHGSKAMWRQQFGTGALLLGAIGGQAVFGGNATENILNLGSTASQLLFLKYGRSAEEESDQLGIEYTALAGYDASQGAAFFRSLKRLSDQAGADLPTLLSSHPDPSNREAYMIERSAFWAERGLAQRQVGRESLFRYVEGLTYGEDPRQGFVRSGTFYHPGLEFRFPVPSGFQVVNQPSRVVMVPESQQAVVIMDIDQEHARARDAAEAAASQQGVQVVESAMGQAGGLPMHYVVADATTQDGQQLRIRYQFIDHAGYVFRFTGMALQTSWSDYESLFTTSMTGFRQETDPSILNIQPDRVALTTSGQSQPFSSFLSGFPLPQGLNALSLAILNQVEVGELIQAGRTLKIVR